MMKNHCDKVRDYVGGTLRRAEKEQFRKHLVECKRCQREFGELLEAALLVEAEGGWIERVREYFRRLWQRPAAKAAMWSAGGAAMTALVVLFFAGRPNNSEQHATAKELKLFAAASQRITEERFARPEADQWQPLSGNFGTASSHVEDDYDRALATIAALRGRGDRAGSATVHLRRREAKLALEALNGLGATPEVESDRGAAALMLNNPDEALALLDRALAGHPKFAQALWNRGLALKAIDAPLAAAASLRESGAVSSPEWRVEAEARAKQIEERARALQSGWNEAEAAGRKMFADGTPPPEEMLRKHPGILRHYLYHAIRGALSPDVPIKLRSTAHILDENTGGTALSDYVERIARANFQMREPLARKYRTVQANPQQPIREELVAEARRTGQTDILIGALAFAKTTAARPTELEKLAAEAHDPWITALTEYQVARALAAGGRLVEAKQRAMNALGECRKHNVEYRCAYLAVAVAEILNSLYEPVDARKQALANLDNAIKIGEWAFTTWAFENLATSSSMLGAPVLARAYLEEVEKRRPANRCGVARFLRVQQAALFQMERRFADARRALLEMPECDDPAPVPMQTAETWGDLARVGAADTARARAILEENRKTRPGDSILALADAVEGRLVIDRDREPAGRLLRDAIGRVDKLQQPDEQAREARALAFATLIDRAVHDERFTEAMSLFAQEAGGTPPRNCAVGISQDIGGTSIMVRGADGVDKGEWREIASVSPDKPDVISPSLLARIEKCAMVDVFARTPFLGRADLLPPQIAWRYRLAPHRDPQPGVPARRVFVSDVAAPQIIDLPPVTAPPRPPNSPDLTLLTGLGATPQAVLMAAEHATVLEIYAHGVVNPGVSDAAHIVLAPDGDRFALTASDLVSKHLQGAPLVLLASCRAATLASTRLTSYSLPAAFIRAGASAVLASPADVPSNTVGPFFDTIRRSVEGGTRAAIALRDARMAPGTDSRLRSIVLFE